MLDVQEELYELDLDEDLSEKIKEAIENNSQNRLVMLDQITQPCALFIGTDISLPPGSREVRDYNIDDIMEKVDALRKADIDAVPCFLPEAQDPKKTVVTPAGIQTPFLEARAVSYSAYSILEALNLNDAKKKGFFPDMDFSQVHAVEAEQMAAVASTSADLGEEFVPDEKRSAELKEKYGRDWEFDLIKEAMASDKLIKPSDIAEKNAESLKYLYRGGSLGDLPYVSLAARENKNCAYASPEVECVSQYSGLRRGENKSGEGVGMKVHSSSGEEMAFGFVYEFEAAEKVALFEDWNIEQGHPPKVHKASKDMTPPDWDGRNLETAVSPQKNRLNNVFLHVRVNGDEMFYPIDTENEKWKDFMQSYRPTDTTKRGFMIDRRNNMLKDPTPLKSLYADNSLEAITLDPNKYGEYVDQANVTVEDKKTAEKAQEAKQASGLHNTLTKLSSQKEATSAEPAQKSSGMQDKLWKIHARQTAKTTASAALATSRPVAPKTPLTLALAAKDDRCQ